MAKAEKTITPEAQAALEEQRRVEQIRERAKAQRAIAQRGSLWSRRDFFGRLSWSALNGLLRMLSSMPGRFSISALPPFVTR